MIGVWRYLFRDNPMQIEALRAVRRLTVAGGSATNQSRAIVRVFEGITVVLYLWFLMAIVLYREDISQIIFWLEFLLLTLLIPGSVYAAISGERERLTWDSLILTRLSPARILIGKLIWPFAIGCGVMLLFTPPLLLSHFLTRFETIYTMGDAIWIQVCLATWGMFLAAFSLFVSAKTRRGVVTLSVVTLSLLSFLILVPGLMSVFRVSSEISLRSAYSSAYYSVPQTPGALPTLAYIGSLLVHLDPAYLIGMLTRSGNSGVHSDYWRDFIALMLLGKSSTGLGIFNLLPLIYLLLTGLCVFGTARTLRQLGLPNRMTR